MQLALAEILLGSVLMILPFFLAALGNKITTANIDDTVFATLPNVIELKDIVVLSITLSTGAVWLLIRHKPESVYYKLLYIIPLICAYGTATFLYGFNKLDVYVASNDNIALVSACKALGVVSYALWAWSTMWRCNLEYKEKNAQKGEDAAKNQTKTFGRDNKKRSALTKDVTGFNPSKPVSKPND